MPETDTDDSATEDNDGISVDNGSGSQSTTGARDVSAEASPVPKKAKWSPIYISSDEELEESMVKIADECASIM